MTDKLPTIEIKGKQYVPVVERVRYLSETIKNYSIESEYEYFPERKMWVVKATLVLFIWDEDQELSRSLPYTGLAQEIESDNYKEVNHTSALENAETSAIGRACAAAGIGLTDSYASADEVVKAQARATYKANPRTGEIPLERYSSDGEMMIDPANLVPCSVCGSNYKFIPAGVSKAGKSYNGFYSCSQRGCKGKTFGMDVAAQMVRKDYKEPEVPMPEEY